MHTFRFALRCLVLLVFGLTHTLVIRFCNTIATAKGTEPGIRNFLCRLLSTLPYVDRLYQDMCSQEKIEGYLIRQRVKLAKKRHDKEYLYNINSRNHSPETVKFEELSGIFPARRTWVHLKKKDRLGKSPIERNLDILARTVKKHRSNKIKSKPSWLSNLDKVCKEISDKCLSLSQNNISSPEIIPILKKEKLGISLYRPVVKFNLEDSIRIGRSAAYIREKFNPIFMKSSYAFRGKDHDLKRCPTHHDAVQNLINYRNRHAGKTLYVAECDIQKFFDIINHDIVREKIYGLRKELKAKDPLIDLDIRALKIFERYLEAYNYNTAIQKAYVFFEEKNIQNADLDKPDESILKTVYSDPKKVIYGVPQGGALSPIIANIVLHTADKEIFDNYKGDPEDLFYARYCDDMILIHPDQGVCRALFKHYCDALHKLKLIIHLPEEIVNYNKNFYGVKSKNPFPWQPPQRNRTSVPWVSFVGYQIHYDGLIRIRNDSIVKEMKKQEKIAIQTIRSIRKKNIISNKSKYQIAHRLKCKLYSMAVGKRYLHELDNENLGLCWAGGFHLLQKHQYVTGQIKKLDRHRERQIAIVKQRLSYHSVPSGSTREIGRTKDNCEYYGHPFSYYSAFIRKILKV